MLTAFLVEDMPDVRDTLLEAMEEMLPLKFIGLAATETAARQWLDENAGRWDLAIIDFFLGNENALSVLQDCQSRSVNQKVVVLTGYPDPRLFRRCLELGADAVFDKSHDVEKLVEFCREHADHLDAISTELITDNTKSYAFRNH